MRYKDRYFIFPVSWQSFPIKYKILFVLHFTTPNLLLQNRFHFLILQHPVLFPYKPILTQVFKLFIFSKFVCVIFGFFLHPFFQHYNAKTAADTTLVCWIQWDPAAVKEGHWVVFCSCVLLTWRCVAAYRGLLLPIEQNNSFAGVSAEGRLRRSPTKLLKHEFLLLSSLLPIAGGRK